MTLRQLSANPARTRRHLLPFVPHSDDDERAPREGLHAALTAFAFVAVRAAGDISFYDLGIPRDIC